MIRMILLVCFLVAGPSKAETVSAKLIKVVDGDTIHLLVGGQKERIRLAEIDTPEKKQTYGIESTKALRRLLATGDITIRLIDVDRYQRWLAHVYVDNQWINLTLVEQGHAWVYSKYATSAELFLAQEIAITARLGLWKISSPKPMPPWQWRQVQRKLQRK